MSRLADVESIILKVQRNLIPGTDEVGMVQVEEAERYFLKLLKENSIVTTTILTRDQIHSILAKFAVSVSEESPSQARYEKIILLQDLDRAFQEACSFMDNSN